ncbi:MAG: hypothetical protein GF331_00215 [Chitinivibrionales bacterium]|nr:hypothetical protein [Chitinivibrionales bacterium]
MYVNQANIDRSNVWSNSFRKWGIAILIVASMMKVSFGQDNIPIAEGSRVLFVGNSLVGFYGPLKSALQWVINSSEDPFSITTANVGKGLGTLYEYVNMTELGVEEKIKEGWDVVVIQGWDDAAGGSNGHHEIFYENARTLDGWAKEAGAVTVFFMHYPSWTTWGDKVKYRSIRYSNEYIVEELDAIMAPVAVAWDSVVTDFGFPEGKTWQEMREDTSSDLYHNMLYADWVHQNGNGTALNAYVFYSVLVGKSPEGINLKMDEIPGNMVGGGSKSWNFEVDRQPYYQRIAWNTVQDYVPNIDSTNIGSGTTIDYTPSTRVEMMWQSSETNTTNDIKDVTFVDAQNGWFVGAGGTIGYSNDGGNSWTLQTSGTTENLLAVAFFNSSIGYAVGRNATILKTVNGGQTWEIQKTMHKSNKHGDSIAEIDPDSIPAIPLRGITAIDEEKCIIVGGDGSSYQRIIARTTNGGQDWLVWRDDDYQLNAIAQGGTSLFAAGNYNSIFESSNSGASWGRDGLIGDELLLSIHDVDFVKNTTGYCGGKGAVVNFGYLGRTTDQNRSWSTLALVGKDIVSIDFHNDTLWALSNSDTLYYYTEGTLFSAAIEPFEGVLGSALDVGDSVIYVVGTKGHFAMANRSEDSMRISSKTPHSSLRLQKGAAIYRYDLQGRRIPHAHFLKQGFSVSVCRKGSTAKLSIIRTNR